jgi:hypothetical protein
VSIKKSFKKQNSFIPEGVGVVGGGINSASSHVAFNPQRLLAARRYIP